MESALDDAGFWNRVARKYARDPITDMPGYDRTIERTRELLAPTDHVLELGCGTGTTALRLAPSVASLVGTDISGEMIAIAREKAKNCPKVRFAVAAAGAVPGEDGTFDAVLAFNLLHLVGDPAATLREAYRHLKPGGLLISKTPCLSEMNALIRLAVPAMRLVGLAPNVSFFDAAALERMIEGAGFAVAERARHGSGRKDFRVFLVARKPDNGRPARPGPALESLGS